MQVSWIWQRFKAKMLKTLLFMECFMSEVREVHPLQGVSIPHLFEDENSLTFRTLLSAFRAFALFLCSISKDDSQLKSDSWETQTCLSSRNTQATSFDRLM